MNALEIGSVDQDIKPFAEFLAYLVDAGLKGEPIAKIIWINRTDDYSYFLSNDMW